MATGLDEILDRIMGAPETLTTPERAEPAPAGDIDIDAVLDRLMGPATAVDEPGLFSRAASTVSNFFAPLTAPAASAVSNLFTPSPPSGASVRSGSVPLEPSGLELSASRRVEPAATDVALPTPIVPGVLSQGDVRATLPGAAGPGIAAPDVIEGAPVPGRIRQTPGRERSLFATGTPPLPGMAPPPAPLPVPPTAGIDERLAAVPPIPSQARADLEAAATQDALRRTQPLPSLPVEAGRGLARGIARGLGTVGTGLKYAAEVPGLAAEAVTQIGRTQTAASPFKMPSRVIPPEEQAASAATAERQAQAKQAVQAIGEIVTDFWEGKAQEIPRAVQGRIWDDPSLALNPHWLTASVAETVPSFAAALLAGAGGAQASVAIGSRVFTLTPEMLTALARVGAVVSSSVVAGGQEGAGAFEAVLREGGNSADAAKAATFYGLASMGLNAISFSRLYGPGAASLAGRAKNVALAGGTEAVTEYLETPTERGIRALVLNKPLMRELVEGLKEGLDVLPAAGLLGAGAKAMRVGGDTGRVRPPEREPVVDTVPDPLATLTPEARAQLTDALLRHTTAQVRPAPAPFTELAQQWISVADLQQQVADALAAEQAKGSLLDRQEARDLGAARPRSEPPSVEPAAPPTPEGPLRTAAETALEATGGSPGLNRAEREAAAFPTVPERLVRGAAPMPETVKPTTPAGALRSASDIAVERAGIAAVPPARITLEQRPSEAAPSPPSVLAERAAPVTWLGWQESVGDNPPQPFWNLTQEVAGHPVGDTVGTRFLAEQGFAIPEAPVPAPAPRPVGPAPVAPAPPVASPAPAPRRGRAPAEGLPNDDDLRREVRELVDVNSVDTNDPDQVYDYIRGIGGIASSDIEGIPFMFRNRRGLALDEIAADIATAQKRDSTDVQRELAKTMQRYVSLRAERRGREAGLDERRAAADQKADQEIVIRAEAGRLDEETNQRLSDDDLLARVAGATGAEVEDVRRALDFSTRPLPLSESVFKFFETAATTPEGSTARERLHDLEAFVAELIDANGSIDEARAMTAGEPDSATAVTAGRGALRPTRLTKADQLALLDMAQRQEDADALARGGAPRAADSADVPGLLSGGAGRAGEAAASPRGDDLAPEGRGPGGRPGAEPSQRGSQGVARAELAPEVPEPRAPQARAVDPKRDYLTESEYQDAFDRLRPAAPALGNTDLIVLDTAERTPSALAEEIARDPLMATLATRLRAAVTSIRDALAVEDARYGVIEFEGFDLNADLTGVTIPSGPWALMLNPWAVIHEAHGKLPDTPSLDPEFVEEVAKELVATIQHEMAHRDAEHTATGPDTAFLAAEQRVVAATEPEFRLASARLLATLEENDHAIFRSLTARAARIPAGGGRPSPRDPARPLGRGDAARPLRRGEGGPGGPAAPRLRRPDALRGPAGEPGAEPTTAELRRRDGSVEGEPTDAPATRDRRGDRGEAPAVGPAPRDRVADARVPPEAARASEEGRAPDDVAPAFRRTPESPEFAPPFYSTLRRAIEARMPALALPPQIRSILKTGGVKEDEIRWTGIETWLDGRTGKVTKQEVLDFLDANEVRVEEVVLDTGGEQATDLQRQITALEVERRAIDDQAGGFQRRTRGQQDRVDAIDDEQNRLSTQLTRIVSERTPKFGGPLTTLPGGENYKELLFVLEPTQDVMLGKWEVVDPGDGEQVRIFDTEAQARRFVEDGHAELDYREITAEPREGREFRSSHWEQPNVLAHARVNDRVDAEGRRVLFVEEAQSDLHQRGRREGYAASEAERAALAKAFHDELRLIRPLVVAEGDLGFDSATQAIVALRTVPAPAQAWEMSPELQAATDRMRAAEAAHRQATAGVPPAPFTKTWHEFVMKRLLRLGAEQGYDSVAWTPGSVQNERYDLSKHVDRVSYNHATGQLLAWEKGTYRYEGALPKIVETVPLERAEDYIGKDAAEKLANAPRENDVQTISGLDLTVGGQGMAGFYDQILPSFLNRYAKKWGARVGETRIQTTAPNEELPYRPDRVGQPKWAGPEGATTTVHALPITESMRTSVLTEGQPMFRRTPKRGRLADVAQGRGPGPQEPTPTPPPEPARGRPDERLIRRAEQHYGVTEDWSEAGYILPDGTMLDFSGKHAAGGYERRPGTAQSTPVRGQPDYLSGQRNYDHRQDLAEIMLDFDPGSAMGPESRRMREFMGRTGAVRFHPNVPGFDFNEGTRPTKAQLRAAIRAARDADADLIVDSGTRSWTFPRPTVDAVEAALAEEADETPQFRRTRRPDPSGAPSAGAPRVERAPAGDQALVPGTPAREQPSIPLRPTTEQRPVEDTPLFGQEAEARRRRDDEAQGALFAERDQPQPTPSELRAAMARGAPITGTSFRVVDSSGALSAESLAEVASAPYQSTFAEHLDRGVTRIAAALERWLPDYRDVRFFGVNLDERHRGANARTTAGPRLILVNPYRVIRDIQLAVRAGNYTLAEAPHYASTTLSRVLVHEVTHQVLEHAPLGRPDRVFVEQLDLNLRRVTVELGEVERDLATFLGGSDGAVYAALVRDRDRLDAERRREDRPGRTPRGPDDAGGAGRDSGRFDAGPAPGAESPENLRSRTAEPSPGVGAGSDLRGRRSRVTPPEAPPSFRRAPATDFTLQSRGYAKNVTPRMAEDFAAELRGQGMEVEIRPSPVGAALRQVWARPAVSVPTETGQPSPPEVPVPTPAGQEAKGQPPPGRRIDALAGRLQAVQSEITNAPIGARVEAGERSWLRTSDPVRPWMDEGGTPTATVRVLTEIAEARRAAEVAAPPVPPPPPAPPGRGGLPPVPPDSPLGRLHDMANQPPTGRGIPERLRRAKNDLITAQVNKFHPVGVTLREAGAPDDLVRIVMAALELTKNKVAGGTQNVAQALGDVYREAGQTLGTAAGPEALNDYLWLRQFAKRIRDLAARPDSGVTPEGHRVDAGQERRGEGVGGSRYVNPREFDMARIDAGLAQLRDRLGADGFARVEALAQRVWTINRDILDRAHDAGIVSQAAYESITARGQDYVPMQVLDFLVHDSAGPRGAAPMSVRYQSYLRTMEGTERDVRPALEASLDKASKALSLIERNIAARTALTVAREIGIATEIPGDTFTVPGDRGVVEVFENGERHNYSVPPEIEATLKFLGQTQFGWMHRVLQAAGTPLRAGATGANLGFMVTNFPRDVAATLKFFKAGWSPLDALRGIMSAYRQDEVYRAALDSGALFSTFQKSLTPEASIRRAAGLRAEPGWGVLKTPSDILRWATEHVMRATNLVEEGTKMAGVLRLARQPEPVRPDVAARFPFLDVEALRRAYEVANYAGSPNFARAGTLTAEMNVLMIFYNARLQGTARTVRRVAQDPATVGGKWLAFRMLAYTVLPTLLLWALNRGYDDDLGMADVAPYDKSRYHILLLPWTYQAADGARRRVYLKLAMDETDQAATPLLRAALDWLNGSSKETAGNLAMDLLGNLSPVTFDAGEDPGVQDIPTAVASGALAGSNPLIRLPVEIGFNYAAYRQSRIIPRALQDRVLPEDQARATTSPVAIGITRALAKHGVHISPINLEYAVTSFTGGLGQTALDMVDRLAGKTPAATAGSYETAARYPILSRVLGTSGGAVDRASEDRVYTVLDRLERTRGSLSLESEREFGPQKRGKKKPLATSERAEELRAPMAQADLVALAKEVRTVRDFLGEVHKKQAFLVHHAPWPLEARQDALASVAADRTEVLRSFRDLEQITQQFTQPMPKSWRRPPSMKGTR